MPYPAELRAAAKAGTLNPNDDTNQNPSYASAAGGVISTADDLATWIRALVGGKVLNADSQRRWSGSLEPEDPDKPDGQKYGSARNARDPIGGQPAPPHAGSAWGPQS
jgi:D-alanyl-D-alanine carboxypeptidase